MWRMKFISGEQRPCDGSGSLRDGSGGELDSSGAWEHDWVPVGRTRGRLELCNFKLDDRYLEEDGATFMKDFGHL